MFLRRIIVVLYYFLKLLILVPAGIIVINMLRSRFYKNIALTLTRRMEGYSRTGTTTGVRDISQDIGRKEKTMMGGMITENELRSTGIIPDLFSTFRAEKPLNISYGGKMINFGDRLDVQSASNMPNVSFSGDENCLYSLLMVDPDAPSHSNPTNRDYLHWMILNVPADRITNGNELMRYMGPSPPQGSGPHRYCFMLLQQKRLLDTAVIGSLQRQKFNTKNFIDTYGMQPVGIQMFFSENK